MALIPVIKDNIGIETEIVNYYLKKDNDYTTKKDTIMYGSDKAKINPTQIGIIVNDYLTKYFCLIFFFSFQENVRSFYFGFFYNLI